MARSSGHVLGVDRRAHTPGTGSSHRDPRFAPAVAPSRISGSSATAGVASGMWMSALLRKPPRRASLDDGLSWIRADWSSAHGSGTSHQLVATAPGATRGHPVDHTRGAGDVRRVQRAVQPSHRMVVHERIYNTPLARSLGTVRRARNRVDIAQRGLIPGRASLGITGARPPARTRRSQRFASSTPRISSSG